MATKENLNCKAGAAFPIAIQCCDTTGPLDLTGGSVRLRISDFDRQQLVLDIQTGVDAAAVLTNPGQGDAVFTVTLEPGVYRYDIEAVLAEGAASDQAFGTIDAADSLFADFT